MNYLFKLLAEGIVNSCKIFDNNLANVVVVAIALFISYNPAWDVTKLFYDLGIIKKSNSGSATHWSVRTVVAIAFIFMVKVIFNIILFIKNNWIKMIVIILTVFAVIFAIKKCAEKYDLNKKKGDKNGI